VTPRTPFPLAHPRFTIAVIVLATLLAGAAATHLRVDNTPDVWVPQDRPALEDYRDYRERFGDHPLILLFTDQARPTDQAWVTGWGRLAEDLRALPGVARVVEPELTDGAASPFPHPLARRLINPENQYAGHAIFVGAELTHDERGPLVGALEARIEDADNALESLRLAGADVITKDLDTGSKRSLGGLSPLVFALMCGILFAATRSATAVATGLAAVTAVSVISLGLFALAAQTLNLVVVTMPAILAVVTIAQLMHLICRFQALAPKSFATQSERWASAIGDTWRPCLLSAVTTAVGFGAIATSAIPPVRNLGAFTAVGVLLAFAVAFTLAPAVLSLIGGVASSTRTPFWTPARAEKVTAWIQRNARLITAVALAALIGGAAGLARLQVESNILTFFPNDHRVPQNYAAVEENLFGLTTFELIVEGPAQETLSEETLRRLETRLESAIAQEPLLHQAFTPLFEPADGDPAQLQRTALPPDAGPGLWREGDRVAFPVTLAAATRSSNACHALAERLRERFEGGLGAGISVIITGSSALLIEGQVLLLNTQIQSFVIALGVVTLVIALAFRSLGAVALSLPPNLLPVIFVLGAMGLAQIPLNTATVTVAGIALGLIVDDTIHFLHQFTRARRERRTVPEATTRTLAMIGRPIVITSVAVAVGFGAFAGSPFRPTLYFGLLIALTSLTAIVCDLLLLPALLLAFSKRPSKQPSPLCDSTSS